MFVNGFVFDDLEPSTVVAAVRAAQAAGAEIFFDAGPRVRALLRDAPAGAAEAVRELFAIADGVLLTQEEAEIVTGLKDADAVRRVTGFGWLRAKYSASSHAPRRARARRLHRCWPATGRLTRGWWSSWVRGAAWR